MVSQEYSEAMAETLDILNHTQKEDVDKISPKFMEYLKNNASKTYESNLDHTKKISDMKLKEKTKVILAIIYRQFWCDKEQKMEFDKTLKNNELNYQKEIREKYNPDSVLKNRKQENKLEKTIIKNEISTVKYKESIFKKFIDKIKNIFRV